MPSKRRLEVKVIAKSHRNFIKEENGILKIYVTAPPQKGRANQSVIELLSGHFGVKKSAVKIIQGQRGSKKVIEIGEF